EDPALPHVPLRPGRNRGIRRPGEDEVGPERDAPAQGDQLQAPRLEPAGHAHHARHPGEPRLLLAAGGERGHRMTEQWPSRGSDVAGIPMGVNVMDDLAVMDVRYAQKLDNMEYRKGTIVRRGPFVAKSTELLPSE